MKSQLLKHSLRVTLAVMALSAATTGFARKLSPDEAISRATEFQQATANSQLRVPYRISAHGNVLRSDNLSLAYTAEKVGAEKTPAFYVFNNSATKDGGFIIATGDDRLRPVLAVVDNGSFDPQNIPDNLKWWLSQYQEEINSYLSSPAALAAEMSASASTPVDNYKEWEVIPYLVTTKWDQGSPYNNLCPMATSSERSVTGCVATAFAQIVNYHKYADLSKVKGTTKTYTTSTTRTRVSYTFPDKFDFGNMLDDYSNGYTTTQANAVAELMKACGVTVDMDYYTSSGAVTAFTPAAAVEYFGYDPSSKSLSRANYQTSEWEQIIYNELQLNRPVVYNGHATNGGHAFVCDGYSGAGMFHINWGWSGVSDGAYALSALNPGVQGIGSFEGGYNSSQGISIFVKPGQQKPDLPENVVALVDQLKIIDSTRMKVTYGLTSASQSIFSTTVGLKLTDANGNYMSIAGQIPIDMKLGYYYWNELTPSYSGVTMRTGKYYLVAVYKDSNSNWAEMPPASPAGSNRILVTVASDGSKTYSLAESEYAPSLTWVLESESDFYMGRSNTAILTVRNDGNSDYTDNLYGHLYNADNTYESYDFEISSGSIIPVSLTSQLNVTFDMSSKNFTAGEWILQIGKKIFDNDSKDTDGQMVLFEGQQKITILPGNNGSSLPNQSLVVTNAATIDKEWLPSEDFSFTFQVKTTSSTPLQLTYKVYKRGSNITAYELGGYYNFGTISIVTGQATIEIPVPNLSELPSGIYDFAFYNNATKTEISERVPISMGGTVNNISYRITPDGTGARIASWHDFSNDLTIPESVTLNKVKYPIIGIGASLFQNSSITSAVIPASIKSIGKNAFAGTKSLENIYFYCSCPTKFAETAFLLTNHEVNVYVNEADYDDYTVSFANITENIYTRIDSWSLAKNDLAINKGESTPVNINRNVAANFNPGVTIADSYDKSVAEITVAEDGNSIIVKGIKGGTTDVIVSLAQSNLAVAKLKITVEDAGNKFDINGDGSINVADITTMVNYVLEGVTDKLSGCDFNNDNVVNIGDINFAVNYIVGGGAENLGLSLGSGFKSLPVDFGYHGRYIAMQADLRIEGDGLLRFIELNKALAGSHILSWGRPENGVVRVMIYSLKNSLINLAEGSPIFTLGIEGSLDIECIKLMYVDENHNIINVTPTSVGSVVADSEIVSEEYFDLSGRKLREASGVCVRKAIHADGTISVTKINR